MSIPKVIADIMTRKVIYLREEDNLSRIEEGMERFNLRHFPVLDGDRIVGLITHKDILRIAVEQRLSQTPGAPGSHEPKSDEIFVASVMTRDPITVDPQTPIVDAARILLKARFGCLPVVDGNRNVVGIVTEHDFLELLVDLLDEGKCA
ncbi:MAG: CBS domain-containing protein [Deltaproteobacteria bacterium]|nr:CBS domain-containing protein [Deltaproteobacteria bacterium]